MQIVILSFVAIIFRILLLGVERIFLKQLKQYDSILIAGLFFFGASIFLLPALVFVPDLSVDLLWDARFAAISSIFYAFGFYLYVKSLSIEDASIIAPLYNSSLLWLLILGYIYLGENITLFRVLGSILIFIGILYLHQGSVKHKIKSMIQSKGSLLMIVGSLFLAIGRTIDTYSIRSVDIKLYAFLINFYVGIYLLIASGLLNKHHDLGPVFAKSFKTLMYASIANGWSYLFLLVAILGLQVTVAEPLSLLSVFVTAFFAKFVLKEKVEQRLLGTTIITIGCFILLAYL